MEVTFSIDFESQEVKLVVDSALNITAYKDAEGQTCYRRLDKLESDELQDKFKSIIETFFSMEDL